MMLATQDDSYLIGQLLDFHAALVRIKRGVATADGVTMLAKLQELDLAAAMAQKNDKK